MTLQTSATPINGKEAAEILERQARHLIHNTPGLDMASSYHRLTLEGSFRLRAYPADMKTPAKEFSFDVNSVSTTRKENEEVFAYVNRLDTIRAELLARLQEVNDILDVVNPQTEIQFELSAADEPDRLRIEQGLPIPVTTKQGGRTIEHYVDAVKNPSTGGFQFGEKK